jgi:hypothetical protein
MGDAEMHYHFPVEIEVRAREPDEWHFPVEVQVAGPAGSPPVFEGGVAVTASGAVVPAAEVPLGPGAEAQLHFPVEIEVRAAPAVDEEGITERTLARLVRALASGDGVV